MALLKIYEFPSPVLAQKARPIDRVDRSYFKMADDLLETMYEAPGVGLAANQVGILERILVIDVEFECEALDEEEKKAPQTAEVVGKNLIWNRKPKIFINPEIIYREGEICFAEGCLSVPEYRAKVKRSDKLQVRYQNLEGTTEVLACEGYQAVALQHEIDHLEGRLFIDHLSLTKRNQIREKLLGRNSLEVFFQKK